MMISGRDPYLLVGPGLAFEWPYPLLYPAPSFVALVPFACLSKINASVAFVAVSAFLLAYGSTKGSWHRVPMFASAAFAESVFAGQWTIALTAAVFIPWLAALVSVKPQTGLAVLSGAESIAALVTAVLGSTILIALSLLLLPRWPFEWFFALSTADHVRAALLHSVGFVVLLLVLRWRRPEAWLVIACACLPQTLMWYSALILLSIANSYREACTLSITSTVGFFLASYALTVKLPHLGPLIWSIFISSTYLPATIVILRRPNDGKFPAWLRILLRHSRGARGEVESALRARSNLKKSSERSRPPEPR